MPSDRISFITGSAIPWCAHYAFRCQRAADWLLDRASDADPFTHRAVLAITMRHATLHAHLTDEARVMRERVESLRQELATTTTR